MAEQLYCSDYTVTTSVLNSNMLNQAYYTLTNNWCGNYGIGLSDKLNNKMKEQKLTNQKVVFTKTIVTEITYEFLAESHEDAIKKINEGEITTNTSKTISVDIVEVK